MASSTAPSTARLLLRLPAANGPVTAAVELLPTRRPRRREAVRAAAHVRRIEAAAWLGRRRRGREEDAAAAAATRCAAAGEVVGSAAGAGIGRSAGVDVAIAAAAVVAMGTGNRVLYKLALVPLRDYPFFLAQFATVGYVVVYFSILYLRHQAGIVTDEMLSLPQKPFLAVGLLEALAAASGMAAGAVLSGASIPILSQTYLVWQLLLSAIFLKRRYRINEITGCFLVTIGVVITVASGSSAGASLKGTGILWPLLMIISFFLQAADTVLKEVIFLNAAKKLKGGSVDLFVVNSYGSAYQVGSFHVSLVAILVKVMGSTIPSATNIHQRWHCLLSKYGITIFGGATVTATICVGQYGLQYITSTLAKDFFSSIPLSIYAFTLPLPYIGVASTLPPGFVAGAAVLTAGLLLYSFPQPQKSPGNPSAAGIPS
uniref:Uncharacterized protein n=1 Tax=Leersia perrieri TaxID=77586 RepID=A0A0D9VAE5_9ORYZ